ncbi:MAG: aspartate 1-decarboxylase [Anaerolineaceae bacterium]|jgi:aspartate 1-decarboxylase
MFRHMLSAKIHRATVTGADVDYIGSITIDPVLMQAAHLLEWERVQVADVTNGARLETYAIPGAPGSGEVQLNGAAAHLIHTGDIVIIMAYVWLSDDEAQNHEPVVIFVDESNRITEIKNGF